MVKFTGGQTNIFRKKLLKERNGAIIEHLKKTGDSYRKVGKKFGLSQQMIYMIVKKWRQNNDTKELGRTK